MLLTLGLFRKNQEKIPIKFYYIFYLSCMCIMTNNAEIERKAEFTSTAKMHHCIHVVSLNSTRFNLGNYISVYKIQLEGVPSYKSP